MALTLMLLVGGAHHFLNYYKKAWTIRTTSSVSGPSGDYLINAVGQLVSFQ